MDRRKDTSGSLDDLDRHGVEFVKPHTVGRNGKALELARNQLLRIRGLRGEVRASGEP